MSSKLSILQVLPQMSRANVSNGLAEGPVVMLGGISGTFEVAYGVSAKTRAGMVRQEPTHGFGLRRPS